MDVAIPEPNGLEVLARVTKEYPAVKVIILSMHANEEYVLRALRAGACGYLVKDATVAELELTVRAVTRDEIHLSSRISKSVILRHTPVTMVFAVFDPRMESQVHYGHRF